MKLRSLLGLLLATLLLFTSFPAARADEGMWTFNNVPMDKIKQRYGFTVTEDWLKKVQLASVRFNNGGSGSFVSPDGLVLTNHHVASDTIAKLSTAEKDLMKQGFLARSQAEELKAPDLELNVLISIEDITDRVNKAVTSGAAPEQANQQRRAVIAEIEKESLSATSLRSDVVTLYQGGQYHLYRYKKYTDVRLVFAPEFEIAFFGGDPDNFTYPRYSLDMTLFRVYENEKPARVEHYFKWAKAGAQPNELVFVSGHPASTQRLNTMDHLVFLRDVEIPFLLEWLEQMHATLKTYAAQGEEQARRAQDEILSVENSLKAYRGRLAGLKDAELMKRKQRAENSLRQQIARNPQKQAEYGNAWQEIAQARQNFRRYYLDLRFFEGTSGLNSTLFSYARTLVRLAAENTKPEAERLPEYTAARRPSLELGLFSTAPIYKDFEQAKLAGSLAFMQQELGNTNPLVKQILGQKTPAERAAELINGTKLDQVAVRKELAEGGQKAIEASTDPLIVLARAVDQAARVARRRYESEVQSIERANYAKIARAHFDLRGTSIYPDATFTLRLSYGAVKGYRENGKMIPPFTTFAGLYERAAQHKNQPPYQLPARWQQKRAALNLSTPFNLVTTNDIIGGNSGSPVINRKGELVGLIFDGNIQSLVGNFIYDETQNRAIAVDTRGMLEALRKVYGADQLADELSR